MRVVLVAPTCDPSDVGEAWVGYQWAQRLSEVHEVTLLTYRKRDKGSVVPLLPRTRVIEWVEPPGVGRLERFNSMLKPGYLPFLRKARNWLGRNGAASWAEVGLQPVPVAMRYPSPLSGSGVPYIVGPVGGSLDDPANFQGEQETSGWYVGLRRVDRLRMKHDRLLRQTYTEAKCVLGIAEYVKNFLDGVPLQRFEVMSETALEVLPPEIARDQRAGDVIRLLFVGRVVRTKGARDAVRAMSHLRDLPVHLDVVGKGSDLEFCRQLALGAGVEDRVTFHGAVSRLEVEQFYARADVFVFPSYREAGGNVPYEALGMGLPMITSNRGGPASVVDDSCGFRLDPTNPDDYASGIAMAVRSLVLDPQLRKRMSSSARARVGEVGLWSQRVERMDTLLREVAGA